MTYTPQHAGECEITATNNAKTCGVNSKTLNYNVRNLILLNGDNTDENYDSENESNHKSSSSKILHQGQILIRKDNKTYKSNGEIVN